MKKILWLPALIGLLLGSCEPYKTQYDGPYEDGEPIAGKPVNYEIWYAESGELNALSADFLHGKTVNTTTLVERVAVNHAHDRIAYQGGGGNIVIIDSSGTQLATVPNSSTVKWFDWHSNNQTLYMLKTDNKLYQYGPAITLSVTNLASGLPFGGATELMIPAAAVLPDGGVVTCFSLYTGLDYFRGLYFNFPAGSSYSDFVVNLGYEEPQKIRVTENGDRVAFTTYAYLSGIDESYYYDIPNNGGPYKLLPSSANLAAISPDGTKVVCWNKGNNFLYNPFDQQFTYTVTGLITALDW